MGSVFKIAAGIFLGLTAFVFFIGFIAVAGEEAARQQVAAELKADAAKRQAQMIVERQAAEHAAVLRDEQNRAKAAAAWQAMQLTGSQQCVGGVVMQAMFAQGVHSVVQLFENGQPVRCLGSSRVTPR